MKIVIASLLALSVAGCASGFGSIHGGECRIFHDPGFAVQGKRLKDKQWIGRTQEAGIQACGWRRPAN